MSLYLIIGIIIVVITIFYVIAYNKIRAALQNVQEAWSDIDVQLNRRHDLIPNLIKTVEAYAKHEKKLFETVTELRTRALTLNINDIKEKSKLERELETTLRSILLVAEGYPTLKANTNYLKLQDELTETEDQIASSRRIYNSNVADYNTLISIFPVNIISLIHHCTPQNFFQKD